MDERIQALRKEVDRVNREILRLQPRWENVRWELSLAVREGLVHSNGTPAGIDEEIAALRKRIAGADHRAIKAGIDSLNAATQDFAARRMDQGIKRALTGQKIVEFKI